MLPELAVIIAMYVCFRMVEVWTFNPDRYRPGAARIVLGIITTLVILVTIFLVVDIVSTGMITGTPPLPIR
jgi:hypothetical protein